MINESMKVIINGLETYLSIPNRPCKVILSNQTSPIPNYPYVAYTLTQPRVERGGTYGIDEDGTRRMQFNSVISFTVQSDDEIEAVVLAVKIAKWFSEVGVTYLSDNGISVVSVGSITNRDNLISVKYEYRDGLDVTISMLDVIEASEFTEDGVIEQVEY